MGTIFAERVLGVASPSVALLSIGEEGGKGEQRVQGATELLAASQLRFVGNAEGKDLPHHPADVVVCDATVGNVTIKFFEGLSSFIFDALRGEFQRWPLGPIGYLFMRPGISRIRRRFDYERLGGAPLLGVKRHCADNPRPRPTADGRLRRGGRRCSGAGTNSGADRRCPRMSSSARRAAWRWGRSSRRILARTRPRASSNAA